MRWSWRVLAGTHNEMTISPEDLQWATSVWTGAIRDTTPPNIIPWAEEFVFLPGSARSKQFNCGHTPWIREPLEMVQRRIEICNKVFALKSLTLIKPIQSGGSTMGKVLICYWIKWGNGNVMYYWPTDIKAGEKWDSEIEPCLSATIPVRELFPPSEDRSKMKRRFIQFLSGANLWCRGAHKQSNVESDNCRYEINEEVHDHEGWMPGRLSQAYGRTSAQWNPIVINISNASDAGDQLHEKFESGTQQHFQVKCGGCGGYHVMQTRWDKKRPDLGGLRYDSDECKRPDGTYDYNKLVGTIRYQMPCGFLVHDEVTERRPMSLAGCYTDPQNTGAPLSERSYTLEAVSVDYIPWLTLISEKHAALRSLKYGDAEPWVRYLKERECKFWDVEDRPTVGRVITVEGKKKNRDGLKGRAVRFFALDRQRGRWSKGETPHWWLLIRDFMPNGDSMLVWEGKLLTDSDVIGVLKDHVCQMNCGVADSSYDSQHVYPFCMANGIHAIKGAGSDSRKSGPDTLISKKSFRHEDGSEHIFSEEEFLYKVAEAVPKYDKGDPREPMFWHYSAHGILERLAWLRGDHHLKAAEGIPVKWEVPEDVSDDYRKHLEGLEWDDKHQAWRQAKLRYDLMICEGYVAMMAEIGGLIGMR